MRSDQMSLPILPAMQYADHKDATAALDVDNHVRLVGMQAHGRLEFGTLRAMRGFSDNNRKSPINPCR